MKSIPFAASVLTVALAGAGCVVVDSQGHIAREDKRFTVTGAPDLQLATFDGSIQVRGGSDREVVVQIEKRGATEEEVGRLQVDAKQEGNRIEVTVKKPAGETFFGFHTSPTANLIVTMPKAGNIVARSGDGSIRIEGVTGKIDLHTGDGSIRGKDVGGSVKVQSGDGSIALEGLEGTLDLDTGDGSVSVEGKPGAVKLHTGDGSITLRAQPGTTMTSEWSMTTGDGGVALYLPRDFNANLDAFTGDGSIHSDLDVRGVEPPDSNHPRRSLRGQIGNGGNMLRVRTGDGSIRLKEQ